MRIPSGKTDQKIFFVALDTTLTTRVTGLSTWTVYRSRNGGTATAYTTPTVTELSAGNMPGVYALTVDEDTTIASTSDSEEYAVHITATGMAPVTRTIELYRYAVTSGTTLTTADVTAIKAKTDQFAFGTANRVNAQTYGMEADVITSTALATSAVTEIQTGLATSASVAALPTAATMADAVWDETRSGHVAAGTFGLALGDIYDGTAGVSVSGFTGTGATEVSDAVWDANLGGYNTAGSAGQAIDDLPSNAELATALGTSDDAVLAQVALVKAKTDLLTFTVANQIDANIQSVNEVTVTGAGTGGSPWGP